MTNDVLITSPNDFKRAYETISKLAIWSHHTHLEFIHAQRN
jgi:glucuronate isomerase